MPVKGRIAFIFALDMAYDTRREVLSTLMGQPVTAASPGVDPRLPREQLFYRPQTVRLPDIKASTAGAEVEITREIKLYSVGAVSIRFTVPFEVASLTDLVPYQSLMLDGKPVSEHVAELAGRVKQELEPFYVQPVQQPKIDQAYTVFCLESKGLITGQDMQALDWMTQHGQEVAGLLNGETDAARLSRLELADVLSRPLSYYRHDLFLCNRQAALLVDEPGQFEPALFIIELTNVQLAELIAYDRILDAGLHRGYRDLARRGGRSKGQTLRSLRELKIDLARLNDELTNINKFQGDWHLARGYRVLADRLHMADWHKSVANKLQTLDHLYQLLKQDQVNRWMMVLEAAIVGLFVFEVVRLLIT